MESLDLACLSAGDPGPEGEAAAEWCDSRGASVDRVDVGAVADGDVDLGDVDVAWWHAAEPYTDPGPVEAMGDPLRAFLAAGGGLLVSLRALSAVTALGVDPVPPDATGAEPVEAPVGPLAVASHADHPLFEGFDGLRIHTRDAGGLQPFARYEDVVPRQGTTLASTVHGDGDRPHQRAVVEWRVGGGAVLGIGTGLAFDGGRGDPTARDRLVENALSYLAADDPADATLTDPGSAAAHRALRARLRGDPHRPTYHLTPPANWLNDPNGLIHWNGRYHVFYQYNPSGPFHDSIHWGHAVSDDLVTWEDRGVALSPDPNGPDRDGCWSGCAVDDDGTPAILYTGGRNRRQLPCLATAADDSLDAWHKHPGNPVIEAPPAELDLRTTADWQTEFRDHSVWREDGVWYHLVGSGVQDVGGTAILYRGTALDDWEYVGPVLVGDWEDSGLVWECPEFLRFDGGDLLHVSNYDEVRYFVGEFDPREPGFDVERRGLLDHGDFYAPQSLRTPDGRTLAWGWLPEARDGRAQWDAGWSGALSVPRELDVVDGQLRQRPAAEVAALRASRLAHGGRTGRPGRTEELARGRSLDLTARVDLDDADELVLTAFDDPDGPEGMPVTVSDDDELTVDRTRVGGVRPTEEQVLSMPVDTAGAVDLRVLVDRSVVEVFVNEHCCLTARGYPEGTDSDRLTLSSTGGAADVESLSVWSMDGVWGDDRAGTGASASVVSEH